MKTLVVAALAAFLCTAPAALADEAKKAAPAPAAEGRGAGPEAGKAEAAKAAKADPKAAERKGDAAAKEAAKPAEKPCEPVKPCSVD